MWRVLPIRRRIFRPADEDDPAINGIASGHAAVRAGSAAIEHAHFAGSDIGLLDRGAIKKTARRIGAGVIDDPLPIGRPNTGVGEDMILRSASALDSAHAAAPAQAFATSMQSATLLRSRTE